MRVLVADADERRRDALVAVLAAEPDLELVTPAATPTEIATTSQVDVVVLVGDLGLGPVAVLSGADLPEGPAWVVLTEDNECTHGPHLPREMRQDAHLPGEMRQDAHLPGEMRQDAHLPREMRTVEAVIAAGAHGCLVISSTPLQISAAVRAAARGERADLDQPVTGPLVQRTPRPTPPLTDREVEVLRLVDAGLGNKQVAERLYLSLSSVKSHLSHTYGRLGVTRRDAAVAEARRQGLI